MFKKIIHAHKQMYKRSAQGTIYNITTMKTFTISNSDL